MADKYTRKCENWLSTFGKWILPVAEAPERFVIWTGLFVLSSVLRRKVRLPKSVLSQWAADPNLYIFFIGDAGRVRKTTTMGPAEELLSQLNGDITFAPDIITKEDLLRKLSKDSPDTSMCIFAPEFSEFVAKSGPTMYSFLTNMYDGKAKLLSTTISRSADYVEKPCLNLLAATTPVWVAANMSEDIIGGGFASRVIFIYEDEVSQRRIIWRKKLEELKPIRDKQREDLIADLKHINEVIQGDFSISDEDTEEWFNNWYLGQVDLGRSKPKLSGYYERRPAHVIKVAMLCHLAYDDSLILNRTDFEMAIDIIEGIEPKLVNVFKAVGKNPYTADVSAIFEYIVEKGRVTAAQIKREFQASAEPDKLQELIDGMIASEMILVKGEDEVDPISKKIVKVFYLKPDMRFLGIGIEKENGRE